MNGRKNIFCRKPQSEAGAEARSYPIGLFSERLSAAPPKGTESNSARRTAEGGCPHIYSAIAGGTLRLRSGQASGAI